MLDPTTPYKKRQFNPPLLLHELPATAPPKLKNAVKHSVIIQLQLLMARLDVPSQVQATLPYFANRSSNTLVLPGNVINAREDLTPWHLDTSGALTTAFRWKVQTNASEVRPAEMHSTCILLAIALLRINKSSVLFFFLAHAEVRVAFVVFLYEMFAID